MRISDWSSDVCSSDLATHAIGDRGNRIVIDTYERVLGDDAKSDHRWRVEHAQIVSPEDIPRFGPLGVIASRSEEHTSELQSLMRISYAVFCLQKKKQKHNATQSHPKY